MTAKGAQLTLVGVAFFTLAIVCLVFVTGRLWNFPLDYMEQQEIPLVQMTVPPFFSVLGSAAAYLRSPAKVRISPDNASLLAVMSIAPGILFMLFFAIITIVFHVANQPGSDVTFTLDAYRTWIMILLSFITGTIPLIAAAIFRTRPQ